MSLVACTFLLALAVWWDIHTQRIPNTLVLIGLVLGYASACLPNGIGWQSSALGSLVGLGVFLPLYVLRILGAGDVKLLAAVGAFVGYPSILKVALLTGFAGGILSLMWAWRYGDLQAMLIRMHTGVLSFVINAFSGGRLQQWRMVVGTYRLPYALAIALGTFSQIYLSH